MEKSGVLSFSNGLEVFLVLAPGIILLILGRRLQARHEKFISRFAASAGGVTDSRDE
jgi:Flp pilus assembly protein TadB